MRLIDADEILKAIDGRGGCDAKGDWSKGFDDACNEIYEIIEDAPTIEAEPVRHANAIYIPNSKGYPSCSCCHEEMPFFLNFCPNCGARMDLRTPTEVELDIVDSVMMGGADNG